MKLTFIIENEQGKQKRMEIDDIENYTFYPATYSGSKITFTK